MVVLKTAPVHCRPPYLLLSAATSYLFLMFGFFGVAMSHSVIPMCLSIMVRGFGSSVLWVYSTLLIQLRVPDRLLGRVLALEIAFFTVSLSRTLRNMVSTSCEQEACVAPPQNLIQSHDPGALSVVLILYGRLLVCNSGIIHTTLGTH